MRRIALALTCFIALVVVAGCPPSAPAGGAEGEGEGEGAAGGEGEGAVGGEGEGEGASVGTGQLGDECDQPGIGACAAGLACEFDTSSGSLDERCATPPSGLPTGAACNTAQADDCASHLCLATQNGGALCSVPCIGNGDCAINQVCQGASVTVDGVGAAAQVCTANASAPPTDCHHDADCTSIGLVCDDAVGGSGGDVTFQCAAAGTGGALGAACASQGVSDTDQCTTGLCDGDTAGVCTKTCTTNGDCGGGFSCVGSGFSNIPDRFCGKTCSRDADCAAVPGRSCQLRDDVTILDQACSQNDGPLTPGTNIQANQQGQCSTGLAVNLTNNSVTTTVCTAICATGADCAGFSASDGAHTAITACQPVGGFTTPNGGAQSVNLCVTP